jgi:hypothetical protein
MKLFVSSTTKEYSSWFIFNEIISRPGQLANHSLPNNIEVTPEVRLDNNL